jgi:23S rRNA (uridine2552-2'-O)-methyltransferase
MLKHKITHNQKAISVKRPKNENALHLDNKIHNHSMSSSSKQWLSRHINDEFVKKSHQEGYISRAAYKLTQIEEKYKIIEKAENILDIGSAPGSWLQVVFKNKEKTNQNTTIVGIDLLELSESFYKTKEYIAIKSNVKFSFICGDFCDESNQEKILSLTEKSYDLILSDLSPDRSGNSRVDHIRIMSIIENIVLFSNSNLKIGGNLFFKAFHGSELEIMTKELKQVFKYVKYIKPPASRQESSEIYIICLKKIR